MEQIDGLKETISNGLVSIETDGFIILRRLITPVLIIYIAFNPNVAVIFLIEYFKIDPGVTRIVLLFALPILVGVTIIKAIFIYLEYFLIVNLSLTLNALKLINRFDVLKKKIAGNKIVKALGDYLLRTLEYTRKVEFKRTANIVLTTAMIGLLFYLQLEKNYIGNKWNFKFNKDLEVISNLHYYCQVTGTYNQDKCEEWQGRRNSLKIPTPH